MAKNDEQIEREINSLPAAHLLLVLLDEARGKPLSIKELNKELQRRHKGASADVEDELSPLERLHLVERTTEEEEGVSVRITGLGCFMALGINPRKKRNIMR